MQHVKDMFASAPVNGAVKAQAFIMPEQKRRKEQIETYAESPFEQALFSVQRKTGDFAISKAWAKGIQSADPQTKDAALTLLKAYLSYTGMESTDLLSPHTQMKLMIFSPHLSEGPLGKAILYESILSLPLPQMLEFADGLKKDFSTLPPIGQALILKQLMSRRKNLDNLDKNAAEEDIAALKKLIKGLVIEFYSNKQEALAQILNKQEKIRLGFLKFHPVEDAYRKELEEIERRYRLKLRQLKKRRSQKVAEAEEEKLRRIEMIYDAMEGSLLSGLGDLTVELDEVLVV